MPSFDLDGLDESKRRKLDPEEVKHEVKHESSASLAHEWLSPEWFNGLSRKQKRDFVHDDFMPDAQKYVDRMKIRGGAFGICCAFLEQLLMENAGTSGNLTPEYFKTKFLEEETGGEKLYEKQLHIVENWPDGGSRVELKKQEIIRIGQKYCDSKMEAEPEKGRQFGAWSAMTNLCEKKSYFKRQRIGREHSFEPTVSGKLFLHLFYLKFPNFDEMAKIPDSDDEEDDDDVEEVYVPASTADLRAMDAALKAAKERQEKELKQDKAGGGPFAASQFDPAPASQFQFDSQLLDSQYEPRDDAPPRDDFEDHSPKIIKKKAILAAEPTVAEVLEALSAEAKVRVSILQALVRKQPGLVGFLKGKIRDRLVWMFNHHQFSYLEMAVALKDGEKPSENRWLDSTVEGLVI